MSPEEASCPWLDSRPGGLAELARETRTSHSNQGQGLLPRAGPASASASAGGARRLWPMCRPPRGSNLFTSIGLEVGEQQAPSGQGRLSPLPQQSDWAAPPSFLLSPEMLDTLPRGEVPSADPVLCGWGTVSVFLGTRRECGGSAVHPLPFLLPASCLPVSYGTSADRCCPECRPFLELCTCVCLPGGSSLGHWHVSPCVRACPLSTV